MSSTGRPRQHAPDREMKGPVGGNVSPSLQWAGSPLALGAVIDRYELQEVLGEGANGVVYRAKDLRLGRPVALKVLKRGVQGDNAVWGRMLREAQTVSRLRHPGICTVYDVGEDKGRAFIAMEYVEGRRLRDMVTSGGLPRERVLVYGAQIASALAHAHQRGIIHCDVKTSNIMVEPNGVTKLLDFGLALRLRADSTGRMVETSMSQYEAAGGAGSLAYLAPEILRGGRASVQSDLWALGVVLYEMATGRLPFAGRTCFEMAMGIMAGHPAALPRGREPLLCGIILRCLQKDCAHRYAAAQEVYEDIQGVLLTPSVRPLGRLVKFRSAGSS